MLEARPPEHGGPASVAAPRPAARPRFSVRRSRRARCRRTTRPPAPSLGT